jgi:RND family efflux transporter MFP subunit
VLLCLIILACGAGTLYYIFTTEPTAERETATRSTPMLVRTTSPVEGTFRPTIEAMGTVEAARDIILRPRVQGEIMERSRSFTPGGFVSKGETVVKLDPADYRNQLAQRRNELQQVRSDLQLEMGRQDVAEQELEMLDGQIGEGADRDLILRKPQLASIQSRVESAKTAVEQAKLELNRTSVNAPFDAHVVTRDANIGSQVAAGDRLARLVGLDRFWVEVQVPLSKMRWITIPDDGSSDEDLPGVKIRDRNAWPEGTYRTGALYKRIGVVGDQTRMAQVLVEVPDPFARSQEASDKPVLMIDAPVEVEIKGKQMPDAVKLDREYVRKNETVWVMSEGTLDIREVDVITQDSEHAYIQEGLSAGDQVVTTDITNVSQGAPLQKRDDEPEARASESSPSSD